MTTESATPVCPASAWNGDKMLGMTEQQEICEEEPAGDSAELFARAH